MNVRSALLFFWPLLSVGLAQGSDLSGIYVQKNCHYNRIEFLADGRYFAHDARQQGKYTFDKGLCVCQRGDVEKFRFQQKGRILVDDDENEWVPREDVAALPWKAVSPAVVVVLDSETRKPISRYAYTYTISTPGTEYDPLWVRPAETDSANGQFQILAPESCQISLKVSGGAILGGYGEGGGKYTLTAENKLRRIEVQVKTGIMVQGVVVDGRTGKPVQDALVSPLIFTPPLMQPDRCRGVKTDAKGRFTLQGIDDEMGISAWHLDYFEGYAGRFAKTAKKVGEKLYDVRIEMETGERLVGVVNDAAGKPLSGVRADDGAGKGTRTDRDGRFVLASPRKWGGEAAYNISIEKDGYVRQELHPKSADPKGLSVTLERQPAVVGRVLTSDGRPVEEFFVAAGTGQEPSAWHCSRAKVRDAQGRFSLRVDTSYDWGKTGKVWIGIKAPGYVPWDTIVDTWKGETTLVAQLRPGVSVYGSLAGRESRRDNVSVTLLPCRIHNDGSRNGDESSQRQELGRMKTTVDDAGEFRFVGVGPGDYLLSIAGPTISPIGSNISVSDKNVKLGEFRPVGTGSISGLVYKDKMICEDGKCRLDEKRGLWQFAEGEIRFQDTADKSNAEAFSHLKPIPFRTDEHGRFHVDGVPVGLVTVSIPHWITADILGSYLRTAKVVEGKTTEVRFFDTSGDWDVDCRFVVGDGSPAQRATGTGMAAKRKVANVTARPPMFHASLRMREAVPGSFNDSDDWEEMETAAWIHLPDVQPGKYRLAVSDWQGSRGLHGVVYQKDVETVKGGTKLVVPLGAGSITGGVRWSKPYRLMIHVIALGKKTGTIRDAYCDEQGNFCTRYLPADEYTFVAHDHDAGWCKLAKAPVNNDTTDIGTHQLTFGGTITGKLPARWATDGSVAVTAVDPRGISIQNPNRYEPVGKTFAISNLWPGKWTVKLTKDDRVIVEKAVELRGTETVVCDLAEQSQH